MNGPMSRNTGRRTRGAARSHARRDERRVDLDEQPMSNAATIATLQEQVDRQVDRIVDLEGACGDLALLAQNGSCHVSDGKLVIEHPRAAELWESIRAALPLNARGTGKENAGE